MRASLLALCLLAIGPSALSDSPRIGGGGTVLLRIGLEKRFAHAQTLLLSSDTSFIVQDTMTGRPLLHGVPGGVYRVTALPDGLRLIRDLNGAAGALDRAVPVSALADHDGLLKIARVDSFPPLHGTRIVWNHYRGTLTVRREDDGTLRVINTVPLEEYLYGVIPAEIGTHVPMEAMKAQAVAARTYALKNRGKFASEGFDLDDTTRSEGYDGWDGETAASNAAVDATRGLVLTWHGTLIDAPYSTDSGGMTAVDPASPYLQAVLDAPGPNAPDYAADAKYHTWTQTFTPAQLQAALARDPLTQVDDFASLTLDGFDASGRITTATVISTDGTTKTVTGTQLRRILGYDVLRSTRVTLTILPDGDYQFRGKGWGHGLGMSQEGAVAMASPPYRKTYADILRHYYVGTTLAPAASFTSPLPREGEGPGARAGRGAVATRPRRGA
ncbi:MAG: SpoIID/LytB domain-containing protein [Armatimonadetes bacterium]|nr:SpoIID/LytB domain-containing protein [Armatimonadota bacterium]